MFEQIFSYILEQFYKFKLVDPREVFINATHIKAWANNKKRQKCILKEKASFYSDRGFQYTNRVFHSKLEASGMIQSMSRVAK